MGILSTLANLLSPQPHEICHLETPSVSDPFSFITNNGSLVSIVKLSGAMRFYNSDQEQVILESVAKSLSPIFIEQGFKLDFIIDLDPVTADEYISKALQPISSSAESMGYLSKAIIKEEQKLLASVIKPEQCYLVITTDISSLDHNSKKEAHSNRIGLASEYNFSGVYEKGVQNWMLGSQQIEDTHSAFVSEVLNIVGSWVLYEQLKVDDALVQIRSLLYRDLNNDDKWYAVTPGSSKVRVSSLEETQAKSSDYTHPPLIDQIIEEPFEDSTNRSFKYFNNKCYAALERYYAGEEGKLFRDLVANLRRELPLRLVFSLVSGTEKIRNKYSIKSNLTTFVARTNPISAQVRDACDAVVKFARSGNCLVESYMSVIVWGDNEKQCSSRFRAVQTALKSWGGERHRLGTFPVEGLLTSLPGFTSELPGRAAPFSISEAIKSVPLIRTVSPWKSGCMFYVTPDCKPWAIDYDDVQDYHTNLISGSMGSGKSTKLAVTIRAILHISGTTSLPMIGFLDFGDGGEYNAVTTRANLPPELRHHVAMLKLNNHPDSAFNLLEPQYGYNYLTQPELNTAVAFLTRIVNGASQEYIHGQLDECILNLIQMTLDQCLKNPIPIDSSQPDSEAILEELGKPEVAKFLPRESSPTYLSARNALYLAAKSTQTTRVIKNRWMKLSLIAHRYAWPLLNQVARTCSTQEATASMGVFKVGRESLLEYISAALDMAIDRYQHILKAYPTKDFSNIRLFFLNVKPIVEASSEHMKKAWFILGKGMVTRSFWLHPDDVDSLCDPVFKARNFDLATQRQQLIKYYLQDEYSQGACQELDTNLEKENMLARKYREIITLATQLHERFPPAIVNMATNHYFCNIPGKETADFIKNQFSISEDELNAMRPFIGTTGLINNMGRGLLYIGEIKASSSLIIQPLISLLPKSLVWSSASDSQDVYLRKLLTNAVGSNVDYDELCVAMGHVLGYPSTKRMIKQYEQEEGLTDKEVYKLLTDRVLNYLRTLGYTV